jgi:hypothetical protein
LFLLFEEDLLRNVAQAATLLERQRCNNVATALRNVAGTAALVQRCTTLLEQQKKNKNPKP